MEAVSRRYGGRSSCARVKRDASDRPLWIILMCVCKNADNCRFRWAACQLEVLRKLHTDTAIHEALRNLPETLDETYERALHAIPDHSRQFAKRAFQWMSYREYWGYNSELTSDALAAAVTLPFQDGYLRWEDQLRDVSDLRDICRYLAAIPSVHYDDIGYPTHSKEPRLSHYTVKEFLISDRIKHGPASDFHISRQSTLVMSAKTVLVFLLHLDPLTIGYMGRYFCHREFPAKEDENREKILALSSFYEFSILSWHKILQGVDGEGGDQEVFNLLFDLLDPRRPKYEQFCETSNSPLLNFLAIPMSIVDGDNWAEVILLSLVHIGLQEAAKEWITRNPVLNLNNHFVACRYAYDEEHGDHCPFLLACHRGLAGLIRHCIIEGRVDYENRGNQDNICPLGLLAGSDLSVVDKCDLIRLMIAFGANASPLPDQVALTPLQVAVGYDPSLEVVRLLLQCGADPNVAGLGEHERNTHYTSRFYDDCKGLPLDIARGALENHLLNGAGETRQGIVDILVQFGAREKDTTCVIGERRI